MKKSIIRLAFGTGIFLLIPLTLTLLGSGVDGQGFHWTGFDFIFAFVLIFGTGLIYQLLARKSGITHKAAIATALLGAFLLVWINGAVGIIGSENNPANLLYGGVLLVLVIGSILAQFKSSQMAYAMFATATAQFLAPLIALAIWRPSFDETPGIVGVLMLNMVFVMLFAGSGILFRKTGTTGA